MTQQRKPTDAAASLAGRLERTRVLEIRVEPEDAFLERVKRRASDRLERRRAPSVSTVSFESVVALLAVLTSRRYELFQAVRQCGGFASIEALANHVQRPRATVSRDVRALSQAGLLVLSEATAPGRGKRAEIFPAAEQVKLMVVL
jgi:predicted transcriptional regulator